MTSPVNPPDAAGTGTRPLRLLAVTACPTGIAHTYMAAEKLEQAAQAAGYSIKVETQGSIGAENVLTAAEVAEADAVIIAADKDVDPSRFRGKPLLVTSVGEGISNAAGLVGRAADAPVYGGPGGGGAAGDALGGAGGGKERGEVYKALMNGVSYMIPFVVVGGLLLALSLSIGGEQTSKGLIVPEDTFWWYIQQIGEVGFTLMIPILSGYIAYAIADRPGLVPGMIGGFVVNNGDLYGSPDASAGFIGAIVVGFLAGYLVRAIKTVKVPKFVQPIMPIIVIPILATTAIGLLVIYAIGKPIAWVFENLTDWLGGMTGASSALLGIILGLMITFDMGGPVNKTAFLFGAGLVTKSPEVMGICAAAIPVPPLGQGLATVLRRRLYGDQEREAGLAALFMGFFGITEGAIPFAAANPARVIPANMAGGAVAGLIAGLASVQDVVPHGGPIVAVLGAVGGVFMFFVAIIAGTIVTALVTVALLTARARKDSLAVPGLEPVPAGVPAAAASAGAGHHIAGMTAVDASGATGLTGATHTVDAAADSAAAYAAHVAAGHEAPATVPDASAPGLSKAPTTRLVTTHSDDSGKAVTSSISKLNVPGPSSALSGYLTAQTIQRDLNATDRDTAIHAIVGMLAGTGKVADKEALVEAVLAREAQGTTGLGEEIAIPHAKTNAVTEPVVGFARSPHGVDWNSMDGTLARLIFMICVPEAMAGDEHLQILAKLSRKLVDPDFKSRLQEAATDDDVMRVLAEIR